jgi:hypothetical protein
MWCPFCNKTYHKKADYRAITKFKQKENAEIDAKYGPAKKYLAFLLKKSKYSKGN